MGRAMGNRRILVFEFLQIVGEDHAANRALVVRDAYRAVDQMADLLRHTCHSDIFGDVLKQILQVDFLLVTGSKSASRLLAHQCDHGNMVHLGIVEAVQKVDRARSGGRVTQAHLTGEFRVRRSHEGRHLFVPDLHVLHRVLGLLQRDVETADAVTGISINPLQSPFGQSMPNKFADVHEMLPRSMLLRLERSLFTNVATCTRFY